MDLNDLLVKRILVSRSFRPKVTDHDKLHSFIAGYISRAAEKLRLIASILLFGMGGVLAFMIEGINVVIPAHYHGSIVGVTLAFMGLSYYLLPKFDDGIPMPKLATWQPWVYAGGQLMHILGLA